MQTLQRIAVLFVYYFVVITLFVTSGQDFWLGVLAGMFAQPLVATVKYGMAAMLRSV